MGTVYLAKLCPQSTTNPPHNLAFQLLLLRAPSLPLLLLRGVHFRPDRLQEGGGARRGELLDLGAAEFYSVWVWA